MRAGMTRSNRPLTTARARTALSCVLGLAACVGSIGDDGTAPASPGEAVTTQGLFIRSGLRRLTAHEYRRVVLDLFGIAGLPAGELLGEESRTPFDNDIERQEPSQQLIEGADALAAMIVAELLADPERRDAVVGCVPAETADAACLRAMVSSVGRRALRRPLPSDEVDAYVKTTLPHATESGDFYVAVASALRALLQSPEFLYRVEVGEPTDVPEVARLTSYEMATRLSFLLWGTTPDEELSQLADADALGTKGQLVQQAERMLDDPRARAQIQRFHALWLRYESLPHEAELAASMQQESRALIDRVVVDGRRPWTDTMLAEETLVNERLAELYQLVAPSGGLWEWVSYGDSPRRGIVSHGSVLSAAPSFEGDTSPMQRGIYIKQTFLCEELPPPPPNLDIDEPPPQLAGTCRSEWLLGEHSVGGCAACHATIDSIGMGLQAFDLQGKLREQEAGRPECVVDGMGAIDGEPFQHASGLARALVDRGGLPSCLAKQLFRFAMGRYHLDAEDGAFLAKAGATLDNEARFHELLLDFVASDAFRHRLQSQASSEGQ
jgi:hypothetical protein